MIVDCYTSIWSSPEQLGRGHWPDRPTPKGLHRIPGDHPPDRADADRHWVASEPVDAAIVVGFKSAHLEAEVPNTLLADYVQRYPGSIVGFAGVDPTDPHQAIDDMTEAAESLSLKGIALSPAAQNFHPAHTNAKACYDAAARMGLPVLFHTGLRNGPETVLQYAQPVLLDEVAREFPTLKILIAHMGFPWTNETITLLAKHANVFSDISWLLHQPWQAYQSLLSAYQHGVMHKLLFGSGFPYTVAASCIEALYGINHIAQGTNLPTIPRGQLRGIVERDALTLLGIGNKKLNSVEKNGQAIFDDEDRDES